MFNYVNCVILKKRNCSIIHLTIHHYSNTHFLWKLINDFKEININFGFTSITLYLLFVSFPLSMILHKQIWRNLITSVTNIWKSWLVSHPVLPTVYFTWNLPWISPVWHQYMRRLTMSLMQMQGWKVTMLWTMLWTVA